MVQSAWIPGNHSIAHYRIESKFRIKYGVVTQSESATEIEMVLPDTSLPQISQSEPFTTNEQSNASESLEKPTAKSSTIPI